MSHTITIRLTKELADWLATLSRRAGIPAGRIIRDQLDRLRKESSEQQFLRHAGKIAGPRDLSARKGFSRK